MKKETISTREDGKNPESPTRKPVIRKATLTAESVKRYRVVVRLIEVSDEERKIKRAIIEDIMRKPRKNYKLPKQNDGPAQKENEDD